MVSLEDNLHIPTPYVYDNVRIPFPATFSLCPIWVTGMKMLHDHSSLFLNEEFIGRLSQEGISGSTCRSPPFTIGWVFSSSWNCPWWWHFFEYRFEGGQYHWYYISREKNHLNSQGTRAPKKLWLTLNFEIEYIENPILTVLWWRFLKHNFA